MVQLDPTWLDASAPWNVKARRAARHLTELRQEVDAFRSRRPFALTPEPTDTPGRLAYRLKFREPIPADLSAIVGDVLHNLRSALECVAYELAQRTRGAALTPTEERATTFPIRPTPESFEEFFTENKRRSTLFDARSRTALRRVQPFWLADQARELNIDLNDSVDRVAWDELTRLDALWNIDKHRRLTVTAWWPEIIYWGSNGESQRKAYRGDGTVADGSILLYVDGTDEGQGDELSYEFNLTLTDDPARHANPNAGQDVVQLLGSWHSRIVNWVFPTIYTALASAPTR
ncbi:hypothetical protein [Phytohabitans kaempferiae]|uniref:Uncharacterized protein n=1 Tax=Phytohabitans kaempferiae TaxID=1620943 RepID=A0ABV6MCA0_9ACTN